MLLAIQTRSVTICLAWEWLGRILQIREGQAYLPGLDRALERFLAMHGRFLGHRADLCISPYKHEIISLF